MAENSLKDNYIHDLAVATEFAILNWHTMLKQICKGMKWKILECWDCIHNYADVMDDGTVMIRKGAVSAREGERVVIPINMKNGAILGTGLGNPEWNYSAPHGSGRVIRRDGVAEVHTVSEYRKEMEGIHSTSVGKNTLDEAPVAYRRLLDLEGAVSETIDIGMIIVPVFNYKAIGKT